MPSKLVDVIVTSFLDGAFDSPPSPPEIPYRRELSRRFSFEVRIRGADDVGDVSHSFA